MVKISSSILSADFACLGEEVSKLYGAGTDLIHIDVMDGHFVPNITIGPDIIKSIKKISKVPFDVHLMIDNVGLYAERFVKAGADILTFHLEATQSPTDLINHIKSLGNIRVGVSIKPATPASALTDVLSEIDLVLIMTVEPGFADQQFMHSQLSKISEIRTLVKATGKNINISVDGGINRETAALCIKAGADILVSGSYIFSAPNKDYKARINELRNGGSDGT